MYIFQRIERDTERERTQHTQGQYLERIIRIRTYRSFQISKDGMFLPRDLELWLSIGCENENIFI